MNRFARPCGLALAVLFGVGISAEAAATPVGSEFQVNSYTSGTQINPSVAVGPDGGFVVVWESSGSVGDDDSSRSIHGQRYDSMGKKLGSQFQVNSYTTGPQTYPSVAIDADGDFVVVWESYESPISHTLNDSIQGQRYDSIAAKLGSQFQVNTYTSSYQRDASVAIDADGNFVVVWESYPSAYSYTGYIQGQRYDSMGKKVDSQFQINSYTTDIQTGASVSVDADGDFVVVWTSYGSPEDDPGYSIQAQRYDATGQEAGSQFQVNSYTTDVQAGASVSVDADGDFVVVWGSYRINYGYISGSSIQAQRYDSTGAAVDSQFQVNSYTTTRQGGPSVTLDAEGNFAVVWTSFGSAHGDPDVSVQGQFYESSGAETGSQFQVNTYTTGSQYLSSVALDPDGYAVVVWMSEGSAFDDQSLASVQGQRYVVPEPGGVAMTLAAMGTILALSLRSQRSEPR